MLTRLLSAAALCVALAAPALGAENAQQGRMKTCNAKAVGMKGEERKAFMSKCLSAGDERPAVNPQQNKMKVCNEKAAGKTGEERKSFIRECLKG